MQDEVTRQSNQIKELENKMKNIADLSDDKVYND